MLVIRGFVKFEDYLTLPQEVQYYGMTTCVYVHTLVHVEKDNLKSNGQRIV